MIVEFTEDFVPNKNGGINFYATAGQQKIVCIVSTEALQDIKPDRKMDGAIQQYRDNKDRLEELAQNKIQKREIDNNSQVFITQSDVT